MDNIIKSKFGVVIDKFFCCPIYPAVLCIICMLCHWFDLPVLGAALCAILLSVSFIFCDNSYTVAPFALLAPYVMSDRTEPASGYYATPARTSVLIIFLILAVCAFAFNLIYYKKWKVLFGKSYLTVSLCLLSASLVIGGLGAETFSLTGIGIGIAIAATLFLPYSLFINCGKYDGDRTIKYFAWVMTFVFVVISSAILQKYIENDFNIEGAKDFLHLGPVGPNTGAAMIVTALPFAFYMIYKYKYGFLFMILVAIELVVIAFTLSRAGTIVAVGVSTVVLCILCFVKKNGRLLYIATFAFMAIVLGILLHKYWQYVSTWIETMLRPGGDSGRFSLWKVGYEAWKKRPVFGIGIWYLPIAHGNWYYSFHNTPFTYLFCGGIVGLIAYVYHRYKTVRLAFSVRFTPERVFVGIAVAAMLLNALLDIGMTQPFHLLYYSLFISLIEHDAKSTCRKYPTYNLLIN